MKTSKEVKRFGKGLKMLALVLLVVIIIAWLIEYYFDIKLASAFALIAALSSKLVPSEIIFGKRNINAV